MSLLDALRPFVVRSTSFSLTPERFPWTGVWRLNPTLVGRMRGAGVHLASVGPTAGLLAGLSPLDSESGRSPALAPSRGRHETKASVSQRRQQTSARDDGRRCQ
jgi:hypothetical protein